ncbi:MAG: DUF1788 domain-containing protein [Chloroflexi bacterium]|nr:DUF1788 domain-containing protein [Chloroflexota bacterium]MBI3732789.1 DUF1788 domain-containing protein [Chloroflexota bacterium]
MSSLKERIKRLEADLRRDPLGHYMYHDLPFATFCYTPAEEWAMRGEVALLKTRLENDHIRCIVYVSLADLLWRAIDESEGLDAVISLEAQAGFDAAQQQINDYLSDPDFRPLPGLLAEQLRSLNPHKDLAFIWRAGALAPNIYRVSKLLDEMKGRTHVPCVLFLPATTEGASLRFMGIAENEGRGSYHTKVYVD